VDRHKKDEEGDTAVQGAEDYGGKEMIDLFRLHVRELN